jgi:hypothetical protein
MIRAASERRRALAVRVVLGPGSWTRCIGTRCIGTLPFGDRMHDHALCRDKQEFMTYYDIYGRRAWTSVHAAGMVEGSAKQGLSGAWMAQTSLFW